MVRGVVTLGKTYEIIIISVLIISRVGTCRHEYIHLAFDLSANKSLYRTVNFSRNRHRIIIRDKSHMKELREWPIHISRLVHESLCG